MDKFPSTNIQMDAFTLRVIDTMNMLRQQGFGPPFGVKELAPCDQRWTEAMTLLLCSNVREGTPKSIEPIISSQAATPSPKHLHLAGLLTTLEHKKSDASLSQETSASSEHMEEPIATSHVLKRKRINPLESAQRGWPSVTRQLNTLFSDVFEPAQFLDFVISHKEHFVQLTSVAHAASGLNHLLDILNRVFPNIAYTGNPISYIPESKHILDKLEVHKRVLVLLRRNSSLVRVTRLAGIELEKDVVELLDRSSEVKIDMRDILERLDKSTAHLRDDEGQVQDADLYYSVFASLLSLTLPTFVTITRGDDGLIRFFARIVDSYTVHYNYNYQDCLRFVFLRWTQGIPRYEKTLVCAYPTHSKYTYDPSLLKWKDLTQQRQDRSQPRNDDDCLPRKRVRELFLRTPRPKFFD